MPARVWLHLQADYDLQTALNQEGARVAEPRERRDAAHGCVGVPNGKVAFVQAADRHVPAGRVGPRRSLPGWTPTTRALRLDVSVGLPGPGRLIIGA